MKCNAFIKSIYCFCVVKYIEDTASQWGRVGFLGLTVAQRQEGQWCYILRLLVLQRQDTSYLLTHI